MVALDFGSSTVWDDCSVHDQKGKHTNLARKKTPPHRVYVGGLLPYVKMRWLNTYVNSFLSLYDASASHREELFGKK